MEIKPEHRWLLCVLFSLKLSNSIGQGERRHWHSPEYRDYYKSLWKYAPKWFKDEARPYLGKEYQAKAKPQNLADSQIMEAINHYAENPS